jgi:hypothetical protein
VFFASFASFEICVTTRRALVADVTPYAAAFRKIRINVAIGRPSTLTIARST